MPFHEAVIVPVWKDLRCLSLGLIEQIKLSNLTNIVIPVPVMSQDCGEFLKVVPHCL